MLKSRVIKLSIIMCLCSIILTMPMAFADENTESFSIYTDKEEYLVGESINIYVKANTIDPGQNITVKDVIVYDSANVSIAEWHDLSIVLTDTTTPAYVGTLIIESEGSFTVSAEATGCPWILRAIWRIILRFLRNRLVPEVPIGTVVSMTTFLGATGLYVACKKKLKKREE